MTYEIIVRNRPEWHSPAEADLLRKNFSSLNEFQEILGLCDNKRRIGCFGSLIIPLRIDTASSFFKDFFLPGFFNEAFKVNNIYLKILRCTIIPLCDVVTLPIRLVTVIPWCVYNVTHPKHAHPFYKYLINNGMTADQLSAGHVYLKTIRTQERIEKDRSGSSYKVTTKIVEGDTFNFIHLPQFVSFISRERDQWKTSSLCN